MPPPNKDPLLVEFRLSANQAKIIGTGLNFLADAWTVRSQEMSLATTYPFMTYPLPPGTDSGKLQPAIMKRICDLWGEYKPRIGRGGRARANWLDLRILIFAARIRMGLWRYSERENWKKGPGARRQHAQDRKITKHLHAQTQRTIESLDRSRRKADRQFRKMVSPDDYQTRTAEWKSQARWIRYHLAYFKCWWREGSGRADEIIDGVMEIAINALRSLHYEVPATSAVREKVRQYLRYCRRGRIGKPTFLDLMHDPDALANRLFIAEFLATRLKLERMIPRHEGPKPSKEATGKQITRMDSDRPSAADIMARQSVPPPPPPPGTAQPTAGQQSTPPAHLSSPGIQDTGDSAPSAPKETRRWVSLRQLRPLPPPPTHWTEQQTAGQQPTTQTRTNPNPITPGPQAQSSDTITPRAEKSADEGKKPHQLRFEQWVRDHPET